MKTGVFANPLLGFLFQQQMLASIAQEVSLRNPSGSVGDVIWPRTGMRGLPLNVHTTEIRNPVYASTLYLPVVN